MSTLPERVDAFQQSERRARWSGRVPAERLARLAAEAAVDPAGAEARLDFGPDARGRAGVTGEVAVRLQVRCQRCLGPLDLDLRCPVDVRLVQSEAEAEREEDVESVVVAESLDLVAFVEEEILLALPTVPRHADCEAAAVAAEAGAEETMPQRRRPFAGLAALLDERDDGAA